MIILDTSIWIEHLRGNQYYFHHTRELLENREVLALECIFGELMRGSKSKSEREIIMEFWTHLPKIRLENIFIEAGEYSSRNKLIDHGVGLIDASILLYGIKSNSKIWTLDNKLFRIIPEEMKYNEGPNAV